jgi:hypothetical protein
MSEDNDDPIGCFFGLFITIFHVLFDKLLLPFLIIPFSKFFHISRLWAGIVMAIGSVLLFFGIKDIGFSKNSKIKYTYHLITDKIDAKPSINKSIVIDPVSSIPKKYPNGSYIGDEPQKDRLYKGSMRYNNGDYYEGDWKNEKREGNGFLVKGDRKWLASFSNDALNGRGLFNSPTQMTNGVWENGKAIKGIRSYKDNRIFIGTYDEEGDWKKGTVIGANGIQVSGEWSNGNANGFFVIVYTDGGKFEGTYVDGNRDSQGKYYYKNGDVYIGEFKNDIRHGEGTFFYKNGDKEIGTWKNGNFERGKKIYHNGKIE